MSFSSMFKFTAATLLLGSLAVAPSHGQSYPDRTIRIVTSGQAGGGGDVLVRYLAEKLKGLSGQPVVVENRPGAAGNIAVDAVVGAKPDGYTLLMAPSSTVVANRYILKETRYDPINDLTPITTFLQASLGLTVPPNSPYSSVQELVDGLRKSDKVLYGNPSSSSLASTTLFLIATGIKGTQVNYRSMNEAALGVTAGELNFVFIDNTLAAAQARQNRLKILAVTQSKRLLAAPSIPTMMESGLANYQYVNFWAAWLPAKTPPDIASKLSAWINEVVALDETKEFFMKQGTEPLQGSPADLAERMKKHNEEWLQIVKETKLEPQ